MATETRTYNGWTNYATWNVKLWLDNDQSTQEDVLDMMRRNRDTHSRVDALKGYVEEMDPLADTASLFADLLGWAIESVNWYEIVEAYAEEIADEEDETLDDDDITTEDTAAIDQARGGAA